MNENSVKSYLKHFGSRKVTAIVNGKIKRISRAESLKQRQVASLLEYSGYCHREGLAE